MRKPISKAASRSDRALTDDPAAGMDRMASLTRRLLAIPKTSVDAALAKEKATKKKAK